jgi:stage IV sporulation protein B
LYKNTIRKKIGIILSIIIILLNYNPITQQLLSIPSELKIFEGEQQFLDLKLPLTFEVETDRIGVIKLNGNTLNKIQHDFRQPISLQSLTRGNVNLQFKLFGLLPIKNMLVRVLPKINVVPGGHAIGVALYTKGALVVGISDIKSSDGDIYSPAQDAGLIPGDIIEKVNNVTIKNAEHLSMLVNESKDQSLQLSIRRNDKLMDVTIEAVKDHQDDRKKLGIWVRDSTAGVGTLSFYLPNNNMYGALGHAITDIDTRSLLRVDNGEIMKSQIIDIRQGEKGKPGEIRAMFSEKENIIGNIKKNTVYGIYGEIYNSLDNPIYRKPIDICLQHQVKEGPATILCTVDDEGIKEYDIEIIRINNQLEPDMKSMIIKINDKKLLSKTGGIVQGMSGSPIIQDNKLVGAVTHVFVNDPTKGYGIFIEWMLKEVEIDNK